MKTKEKKLVPDMPNPPAPPKREPLPVCSNSLLAPFKVLALGTRFKYTNVGRTWVKLSNDGTITEWDDKNISNSWIGQSICCFNDEDNFDVEVLVVC